MRRMIEERCLGSLFGDVGQMAAYVGIARVTHDVTVWLNTRAEVVCSSAGLAPMLPAEYLLGTYGIGADIDDIREDFLVFRNERASHAMIF